MCAKWQKRGCVCLHLCLCVYVSSVSHLCGRYNIILGKEIFSKEYEARPGCRFITARFFSFDWELFHVALWTLFKCHKFQLWFLRLVKLYNLLKVTSNLSCHVLHCQEPQRWHGIYGKYQIFKSQRECNIYHILSSWFLHDVINLPLYKIKKSWRLVDKSKASGLWRPWKTHASSGIFYYFPHCIWNPVEWKWALRPYPLEKSYNRTWV